MIKVLTGEYQKHIAWLLFFVFYGELAATLYASRRINNDYPGNTPGYRYKEYASSANNYTASTANKIINEDVSGNNLPVIQSVEKTLPEKNDGEEKINIGGPGQPEMNTFKSIGADNMVNLFTGDFSYNIPLLDVGGYPVNIFYNAGITMDQEASWVGLGWNINPGTINRTMRGLPDDYNGQDSIIKEQSIKPDLTVGVTGTKGMEATGIPNLSASYGMGIFYNNRRGLGLEASVKGDYKVHRFISKKGKTELPADTVGGISIAGGINLNSQNGMTLNAGFDYSKWNTERLAYRGFNTAVGFSTRRGLTDISIDAEYKSYKWNEKHSEKNLSLALQHETNISFARSSYTPSIRMPLTRFNGTYTLKLGSEKKIFFKNGTISGYVQESRLDAADKKQTRPAYGYMYYEKGNNDKNGLLDFNRLNDGTYTVKTPVISIPVYTYDIFNISGEGTGGSFRGYRGNMGFMRDNYTKTKTGSFSVTLDLGPGGIFHGGTMLGGIYSPSFVRDWEFSNGLRNTAVFNSTDSIYQSFYFKNPGEKAIIDEGYYEKMGADQLIRPYLNNIKTATPSLASKFQVFDKDRNVDGTISVSAANTHRAVRDKRTQVITYLTAEDASNVGLDTCIYSYTENLFKPGSCSDPTFKTPISRYNRNNPFFYRKKHHISEVDVLEPDGRRYVYGIPVYQVKQEEVTFSTEETPQSDKQLISYTPGNENSVNNKKGRDGFYQSETMNGYAHSFLLTGILSPDYVDVRGDGITDDDLGTAIHFNYSRVDKKRNSLLGGNYWNNFKWRTPALSNTASYNEGLKADNRDDKGLYTYGEKELWYLHSIESKNMVATFYTSQRNDGNQVLGKNGGIASGDGQKKLDKINLYTKADYLKYGSNARPVKTVHFKYSYKLCPNYSLNTNSLDGGGKMTLDAIWFSYNGNNNQVKNKYVFKYAEKIVNNINVMNPGYNAAENDRWGNYKPYAANPEMAANNDYPYTIQDTAKTNEYAAAWNLQKILLPGGAVLNVKYEADDYAFVQDKRASQMTKIAGFGKLNTSTPSNELYTWNLLDPLEAANPALMDHRFVFFDVDQPLQNVTEINEKYLQGFKQLLLKLWVKMPRGNVGNSPAYEPVIVYGAIRNYGITSNPNRFYVELEETRKGGSPVMETVLQFLKDHLPQRAYPGYETIGDGALAQIGRSLIGLANTLTEGVLGFEKGLKLLGKCKEVQLSMSFARLNNPSFKKIGGGLRVKAVTINDNWNRMTGQFESMYGQVYNYTTTELVNGQKVTISSGVAAYEPGIGNEENPFREVLKYSDKQFLGPTDHSNVELPVAETFFPSPMVGYSRVTVKSIHNKTNKKIKSVIGFQQTEFYTARDFPVISEFTSFDPDSRHHHKPSAIEKIFNFNKRDYLTLTQGFRIVVNDMNGKLKSQTSYAENDSITPVNYTANYYRIVSRGDNKYKLDNILPVVSGPDGKISHKLVGKDIEVMNDFREHFSYTYAANIPINAEFFTLANFPVIIPTIFRLVFRDESMYRSATTLKIVNEYGILDSVVNIDKGSLVGTKNMIYDAESGDVLVSRTNNEFNKPIYQFNYPAWWENSGMEPAYRNIDLTYKGILFRNGRIEGSPADFTFNHFESGDEIYVNDNGSLKGPAESPGCIAGGYPAFLPASSEYRIWVLDIRKDQRNTEKEFIFIDRYGNPYNAANATIRIIRSGKRNLAGTSVGSIVSLKNPVRTITNQEQVDEQWIVIDSNSNVINAGAAEFKERWRVNDMFYAKDTSIVTTKLVPLKEITIPSVQTDGSYSIGYYRPGARASDRHTQPFSDPDYFMARQFDEGKNKRDGEQKSWVLFDFGSFSLTNTIVSAKLSLYSHKENFHSLTINGYTAGSHTNVNPHVSDPSHANDFFLQRMLSAWPANDAYSTWYQLYGTQQTGSFNEVFVRGTSPQRSTKDYIFNNTSNTDNRIDVTSIVKGMVRDKYDPAKSYATALKISMVSGGKPEARVCFYAKNAAGGHLPYAPKIDVKYYNCDDTYISGPSVECPTVITGKLCFSVFSKKQMNPYIEGVLGNWRGWKSYVYYGDRRETDPTLPTDIRKDGIIRNFETYWAFAAGQDLKLARTNNPKWVWNSEITQYNRKGAELENRDPLGRYNAGIYGYQESLPVSVVNNSRLRLSAFDGFEDYSYQDDPCEPYCKPSKRHFTTGVTGSMLDSTESHTGKYSVKIAANNTFQIDVKVSDDDDEVNPDVRIKLNKTPYSNFVSVTPNGSGLRGSYYNDPNFVGTAVLREDAAVNLIFRARNNSNTCRNEYDHVLPAGIRCGDMSVRWEGKIQVISTGSYEFSAYSNDFSKVLIDLTPADGIDNFFTVANGVNSGGSFNETRNSVTLSAGVLYPIKVELQQLGGYGEIHLAWKRPGDTQFGPVAFKHLYPLGKEYLADGSTVTETVYCIKPDTIQAINHHLIDSFNLVPNKKMVASVWMKKGGQDCKCNAYNNSFAIRNAGGGLIASFTAKERIIEGWQQFEAIFTVPENNDKIILDFQAPSDALVYMDDLRIHPFNANMKSFVYDPVTLRLAAELDENNFASFYEYDDDGGLIRVKKETRLGIKTITETRSAVQKNITDL